MLASDAALAIRVRALLALTRIAVFCSDQSRAGNLSGEVAAYPYSHGCHEHLAGMAAATAGLATEARGHFQRSWQCYVRGGNFAFLLETAFHFGELLLSQRGHSDVARATKVVGHGLETARASGARLWAERLAALHQRTIEPAPGNRLPDGLTDRELDVLCQVAAGKSNKMVAGELDLTASTVATRLRSIYGKIGAANRADATAYAIRHRLDDLDVRDRIDR